MRPRHPWARRRGRLPASAGFNPQLGLARGQAAEAKLARCAGGPVGPSPLHHQNYQPRPAQTGGSGSCDGGEVKDFLFSFDFRQGWYREQVHPGPRLFAYNLQESAFSSSSSASLLPSTDASLQHVDTLNPLLPPGRTA